MTSPVISRRTKLLIFAVVAKTLDCGYCQMEAKAQLISNELSESEFDEIIGTLGSPVLDPAESSLMAWARDTVRFHPLTIQHRTLELRDQAGSEVLIEAVGVASLANAVVRLAMLLE